MSPEERIVSLAKGLNTLKAFGHLTTPETRASISVISGGILGLFKSYTKNEPFQPTAFFETPNAIGLTIASHRPSLDELPNTPGLKDALKAGYQLPNLSPFVFTHYYRFLEEISEQRLIDNIGDRVFEFSGLVPITEDRASATKASIKTLLEKHDTFLKDQKVIIIDDQEELVTFRDKDNLPIPVKLHYIKQGNLDEGTELLKEEVLDSLEVMGIATPLPGENKRQHYARIQTIETRMQGKVASGWPGQFRLWERLGFDKEIPTANPEASLSAHQLVRYLILGDDNLHPGHLAKFTSLPIQGFQMMWPGLDIILNHINPNTGVRNVAPLFLPLRALDKNDTTSTLPLKGVAAIKIIPDNADLKAAVENNTSLSNDFARVTGSPAAKILLINQPLYHQWRSLGSPIAPEEEVVTQISKLSPRKATNYSLSSSKGESFYVEFSVGPGAGGGMRAIVTNNQALMLDVGTHFDDNPKGYRGMGKRPPTAEEFVQNMRLGIMPPIPWLWSDDVLKVVTQRLHTIDSNPQTDWLASFIMAEITRRKKTFDFSGLSDSVIRLAASGKLANDDQSFNSIAGISNSHAHDDHHHFLALTDGSIPIILSTATFAILTALSTKALTWQTKYLRSTHFSENKRPYPTTERKIFPIHDSEPHPISSALSLTHIPIPHAIPSVARIIELTNGHNITLFDPGDWKNDKKNGAMIAFERAKKFNPQFAAIEMTMIGRDSPFRTEEQVRDTILDVLKQTPKTPAVIILPINGMERIKNIVEEIGSETHRTVALDYPIAEIVRTLSHFKSLYPKAAGLELALEKPFGPDLTVWLRHMTTSKKSRKDLVETLRSEFGIDPLTPQSLSANGGNPIILVSPYSNLGQFDGINFPDGVNFIYAASSPFDQEARDFMAANRKALYLMPSQTRLIAHFDITRFGGMFGKPTFQTVTVSGPLHASGHATQKDIIQAIDILREGNSDLTIIPYHTARPAKAVEIITKKLGTDGLKFITRKPRLHLENPLENGIRGMGFWLPLN